MCEIPRWAWQLAWLAIYSAYGAAAFYAWRQFDLFADIYYITGMTLWFAGIFLLMAWAWLFFGGWIRLAASTALIGLIVVAADAIMFYFVNYIAGALASPLFVWMIFVTVHSFDVGGRTENHNKVYVLAPTKAAVGGASKTVSQSEASDAEMT